MSRPAVLRWHRHLGRITWTGLVGAVGLMVVLFGWIGLLLGDWVGLGVVIAGVVVTVSAELLSRRFWAVTTAGLRWPVPFGAATLPWHQVRATTRQPMPARRDGQDRILVHRSDGGPLTWPRPQTHGRCVDDLRWWEGLHHGVPQGDWRAVPNLRFWHSSPERIVSNPGGRRFQAGLATMLLAGAVAAVATGIGRDSLPALVGWLVVTTALTVPGVRAVRRAAASVAVHPTGVLVHRFPYRKEVPGDRIVGCLVEKRPKLVSIGAMTAILLILNLDDDAPDHQYVPTLVLTDGSAVPVRALFTRSRARAEALALQLMDPAASPKLPS